jgi:hypothetical protein
MITDFFKGGEFYAESTGKRGALRAEWWNSSVKQPGSVGAVPAITMLTIPMSVAARINKRPGTPFTSSFPHHALNILNIKMPKLHTT